MLENYGVVRAGGSAIDFAPNTTFVYILEEETAVVAANEEQD